MTAKLIKDWHLYSQYFQDGPMCPLSGTEFSSRLQIIIMIVRVEEAKRNPEYDKNLRQQI